MIIVPVTPLQRIDRLREMTTPHDFSPVETAAAGMFCTSGQRPIGNGEKVEVGGVMVDIMKFNWNVNPYPTNVKNRVSS
jgi:O-acetylhomoserine/O-acetylserine sulfhydrylase-like pyridoxal-dependent enzyme